MGHGRGSCMVKARLLGWLGLGFGVCGREGGFKGAGGSAWGLEFVLGGEREGVVELKGWGRGRGCCRHLRVLLLDLGSSEDENLKVFGGIYRGSLRGVEI
jgi:hypothetical protein